MSIDRVEIWTDVECNSGTHEGNIPRHDLLGAQLDESIDGKSDLSLTIDRSSPAWAEIDNDRVFRVMYEDGTVSEFRIVKPIQSRDKRGAEKALVKAVGIFMDLANGIVSRDEADGVVTLYYTLLSLTRAELVALIVAEAPSYFDVGTITDSTTVVESFTFNYDTPLKALQELAAMENLELAVRRNGSTDYKVDLIEQIGSSATIPEFRYRKNLNGVKRESDSSKMANRIYPAGGSDDAVRLSIAEATWEVEAVGTDTVDLAGSPIFEDDQFNGSGYFYLLNVNDGTHWQISDTDVANQRIETTSAHDIVQGDIVKFRYSTDGSNFKRIPYIESPLAQAIYGVKIGVTEESDLPMVDNLVLNPALNDWSGGLQNWSAQSDGTAPTISQNANPLYTKVGGSSARVQCNSIGDGIKSADITIAPANPQIYFSGFIDLFVVSGTVEFYLLHSTEGRIPLAGDPDSAITSITGRWDQLSIETGELPAGTVALYAIGLTATTEFYLDSAQFTNSGTNYPFFAGNAARTLWQRGMVDLAERIDPAISYSIEVDDLYVVDSSKWPYDEITLGGTVFVEDEQLTLQVETRAIEVRRNLLTAHAVALTLSNKSVDLIDILTRRHRRVRQESVSRPSIAGIDNFVVSHLDDGTVQLQVWGNRGCNSIKYIADLYDMPTFAEVIASGGDSEISNVVDGTPFSVLSILNNASSIKLGKGKRCFVRAVAFPIINGGGVPGSTAVGMVTPVNLWNAEITGTYENEIGSSPDIEMKRTWAVDDRCIGIKVYRKTGGWPTIGGDQTGQPDPGYDRGTIGADDNWEYKDGGYTTSDVVYDIAIAYDINGKAGEREENSYTITNTGTPQITAAWRVQDTRGTACGLGNMRRVTINWTIDGVSDTYDLEIYRVVDGFSVLARDLDDPSSGSWQDIGCPMYGTGPDTRVVDYVLKLVLEASPFTVLDQVTLPEDNSLHWNLCVTPE